MEIKSTQVNDDVLYWEKMVASRRGPKYTSDIEEAIILKAHSLCVEPTTALEVGCEGGRWSYLLAKRGWKIICTEIAQPLIDFCQQRMPQARCILVDPRDTTLPCDNESVDLVLCIEVPAVIQSGWFAGEVSRVLRKEGLFVGVIWNRSSWRGLMHHAVARLNRRSTFWYATSYQVWKTTLIENGFILVDEVGMCWFPFNRKSNSPLIPVVPHLELLLGLRKWTRFSPLVVFIAKKVR